MPPILGPWVAQVPSASRAEIAEYPIADGETISPRHLVTLVAGEVENLAGTADPTGILGVAESGNADGEIVYANTCLVALAKGDVLFAMRGSRAPLATDVGVLYGLVETADGEWTVDAAETVNTRIRVHQVFIDRELWIVSILEAHRQIPV